MNKRQMGKMMRGAFTLSALSLSAADLTLVGDGTAVWNRSTANWKDANGQETRYADGDNVTIGGEDFTGVAVTLGAEWLDPGNVVFSNEQEIVLSSAENKFGFGSNTKSLSKWGGGTLRLKPMWNYNVCDWHVYGGLLTTEDAWCGDNTTFGHRDKDVTIHVHDGATLENPGPGALGGANDTAEAEDRAVSVTVHAGGMFRPGKTGTYDYPFSAVKDLVFDGGSFDFSKRGYWEQGLLKVTRTLAFGGSTPYTLNQPSGNSGKIAFAASRQTELYVADMTGDDAADVTISTENVGRMKEASVVGVRKTGPGTLRWNAKIHNSYNRGDWVGWLGLNGKITVEEGRLVLANAANAMEGDLEVSGGELWLGEERGGFVATDTHATYAGNLQVAGREIVASGTGRLVLPKLFMFGGEPTAEDVTPDAVTFVARDNGEIHIDVPGNTGDYAGCAVFPNLRLEGNGRFVVNGNGYWSKGAVTVLGTFAFAGTTPVTVAANSRQSDMMSLNSSSGTTFDVADITGDSAADVVFRRPIGRTKAQTDAGRTVGFRKTGPGTLELAYDISGLGAAGLSEVNGTLQIAVGAVQVAGNGKCICRMGVEVAAGAFVQPGAEERRYEVARLAVAEGGGFRVKPGDRGTLFVTGKLELPANGICDIYVPDGESGTDLKTTFLTVKDETEVVSPADFSGWTFTVNGRATVEEWKISRKGNRFAVRPVKGLCLLIR